MESRCAEGGGVGALASLSARVVACNVFSALYCYMKRSGRGDHHGSDQRCE